MSKTNDISILDVSTTEEDSLNNFPPLLETRFEDFDSRSRGSDYYACVAADQTYSHGEQWHPLFAPFGRAHCVICICTFGESVCNRVECPAVEDMPCKNPVTVRGQCCKICEDEGERKNDSYVPLCLTEFETHLVYIYQPKVAYRDGVSIVTYAVEDIARHTVRISQWEISLGTIEKYLVEDIPSVNFERAKETREHKSGRFHLTGATTQRNYYIIIRTIIPL
ncbi:putative chordin-like protein 1 [Apostichopus japonicus]|uniref:Putative chordin-like protein 1 n=1 Tax=Stichopus japonicus TaxID=307972 RepID=A0A2G8KW71_STIJA|nr:putative chordin-like protein 1 [Apostichopus japonicus]